MNRKQMEADERQNNDGRPLPVRLLRLGEAAELLGVSPNTVRFWTESGVLKSYRIGPRRDRRIPADAVEDFIKAGRKSRSRRETIPEG
jgi:excisionase family DNA binding protein